MKNGQQAMMELRNLLGMAKEEPDTAPTLDKVLAHSQGLPRQVRKQILTNIIQQCGKWLKMVSEEIDEHVRLTFSQYGLDAIERCYRQLYQDLKP